MHSTQNYGHSMNMPHVWWQTLSSYDVTLYSLARFTGIEASMKAIMTHKAQLTQLRHLHKVSYSFLLFHKWLSTPCWIISVGSIFRTKCTVTHRTVKWLRKWRTELKTWTEAGTPFDQGERRWTLNTCISKQCAATMPLSTTGKLLSDQEGLFSGGADSCSILLLGFSGGCSHSVESRETCSLQMSCEM